MKKLMVLASLLILVTGCAKEKEKKRVKNSRDARTKIQSMISQQMPYDYFVDAKTPDELKLDNQPKRACKDEDIARLAQDEQEIKKTAAPIYTNIDLAKTTMLEDKIKTRSYLQAIERDLKQTQSYCKASLSNPIDIANCSKVAVTSVYTNIKTLCQDLAKIQESNNTLLVSITPPTPN